MPDDLSGLVDRFRDRLTHSVATLRCKACGDTWNRDQWASCPVNVDMEEVDHAVAGCNGRVVIDHVHEHVLDGPVRCKCMIPPEPRALVPLPPPDPSLNRAPVRK